MLTKLAFKYLVYKLKKDKSLWFSWQSNISMVIYHNFKKYYPELLSEQKFLVDVCNKCAKDFLILLTKRG